MADPAAGFTTDQIVDIANRRTEKRGKALDLSTELLIALQEFCQERRWWWRRMRSSFATVAGTPEYDLADAAGANAINCERIRENGVKLYVSASDYAILPPMFDVDEQDDALDDDTQARPGAYFIKPGTLNMMRLVPVPDGVYTVRVSWWALPNLTPDALATPGTAIPLVPGYLHHVLIKKLEAQIFRFALGEGSEKYQAAMAEYQRAVERAALNPDFAEGRVREWTDRSGEAIQSS